MWGAPPVPHPSGRCKSAPNPAGSRCFPGSRTAPQMAPCLLKLRWTGPDRTGQDRTGERSARQAWQPGGESLTLHPSRATVRALVFPRPCSLKGSCLACRWRAHWARPTPWLVVRIQEVGPRGAHRKAPCELDAELRVWRKSSTKARLEGRGPGEAGLPAGPTSQHPAGPAPGGPPWNA